MRSRFYQNLLEKELTEVSRWRKKDQQWVWMRAIVALAFIACFIVAMFTGAMWWLVVGCLGIAIFVLSVVQHSKARMALHFHRVKAQEITNEIDYLQGKFDAFQAGDEFRAEDHPYANDLDVFGPRSLFQRIDRSLTEEGKQKLANAFMHLDWKDVPEKQQGVSAISSQIEETLEFRAIGRGIEDHAVKKSIDAWLDQGATNTWWKRSWLRWIATLVFPACLVVVIFTGSWQLADLLVYPFLFNLILFGASLKAVKASYGSADRVQHGIRTYGRLIEKLQQFDLSAAPFEKVHRTLFDAEEGAVKGIRSLAWTLGQLDSMGNLIGAAVMNGCFLYHLHIAARLTEWKDQFGGKLTAWLDAVNEMEMWISLGQFHFNHPTYTQPTVSDQRCFEAEQIAHPFIDATHRVANDITFDGFQWVVLTGSNMAGKSTLLRSIGLNVILAANGLSVCAAKLHLSGFQLLTSMKPQDSVNDDRSYFQAEVLRLKMIMESIAAKGPSMLLFDEILRGTNSEDKRNGTLLFLKRIREEDALGVIATHDIEITDISSEYPDKFQNYFFESKSKEGQLYFDYKLRKGVCGTPNATELLRKHGII